MTTEAALFAAILAHPLEDTTRLAFADWLDEQGDEHQVQQAEYLRLAIAREPVVEARHRGDPDAPPRPDPAETERFLEMEKAQRSAWQKVLGGKKGPLRGRECWFHFTRGFPQRVAAPVDRLLAEGDQLFRLTPVVELSARNVSADNLPPLLAQPWLAGVRDVYFNSRYGPGPRVDWAALARAPRLPGVESLWIDDGSLSPLGATEVVVANPFPRLRKFHSSDLSLATTAAVLFGDAPIAPLEEVYASNGRVTTDGLTVLMNSRGMGRLRKLSLPSSPLPAAALAALTGGRHWATLRELVLYSTSLTDESLAAFAAAPPTALESLEVSMNRFGPAGVIALADSPLLAGLRKLNLGSSPVYSAGAMALAASPNSRNLRSLQLGNAGIWPEGAKAIARSPHLAGLRSLVLSSNPITVEGAMALAESPHLADLEYLSLSNVRGKARKALTDRFGDRVRF